MDRTGYRGSAYQYYVIAVQSVHEYRKWSRSTGNNRFACPGSRIHCGLFPDITVPVEFNGDIADKSCCNIGNIYILFFLTER